MKKAIDLY